MQQRRKNIFKPLTNTSNRVLQHTLTQDSGLAEQISDALAAKHTDSLHGQ